MRLIGLAGPKRSGKGTVANFIGDYVGDIGKTYALRGFSDALKLSAYRCFNPKGHIINALDWELGFKTGGRVFIENAKGEPTYIVSGREFLQNYGTEAHRQIFGQDFWVDYLLPLDNPEELNVNFSHADVGIITDMRFDNEAERIHELGGVNWSVRINDAEEDTHESEAGISPHLVDRYIDNNGSLQNLEIETRAAAMDLLGKERIEI